MLAFPIIAFVVTVLAIVFMVQNITPVTVTFLLWQLHGSIALTLLATFLFGAAVALLALVPVFARRRSEGVAQTRREAELRGALDENRRRLDEDRSRLEEERHRLEEERRRAEGMRQMTGSRSEAGEKKEEKENQSTPSS